MPGKIESDDLFLPFGLAPQRLIDGRPDRVGGFGGGDDPSALENMTAALNVSICLTARASMSP